MERNSAAHLCACVGYDDSSVCFLHIKMSLAVSMETALNLPSNLVILLSQKQSMEDKSGLKCRKIKCSKNS